jgi:hypothetical protein
MHVKLRSSTTLLALGLLVGRVTAHDMAQEQAPAGGSVDSYISAPPQELAETFVLRAGEDGVSCQSPSRAEAAAFLRRSPTRLHQINHLDESLLPGLDSKRAAVGLTIILRATEQLEFYPSAKEAFLKAAETWESMINVGVTIYVDVDFGLTNFGVPFTDGRILGLTHAVRYTGPYTDFRARMVAIFPTDPETQALPLTTVPTDLGPVDEMSVPDAVLRRVGLRPGMASPSDSAASIGFNAAFAFDFDPRDGIPFNLTDFMSVAVHELGHVLGFTSNVGATELDPLAPLRLSPLDLHRFSSEPAAFQTSARVMSSGGDHLYYTDGYGAPLSTGRPDATGGDMRQPSHWKDDAFTGYYVGIMDPTLRRGLHVPITYWDLIALNRMAYGVTHHGRQAWIYEVSPDLVRRGSGIQDVTLYGEDFEAGAQVMWRGVARPATVLSDSSILVPLSSADLQADAVSSIEVVDPDGIPSNTIYFEVGKCFRCTRVVHRPSR